MRKPFLTGFLLLLAFTLPFVATGAASGASVRVGSVVHVSGKDGPIFQMWAFADPHDARYLMACGSQNDPSASDLLSGYVYVSADGGLTWSRTLRDNSSNWVSEESCAYGSLERVYYAAGVVDAI